jgi:hypothetical protein
LPPSKECLGEKDAIEMFRRESPMKASLTSGRDSQTSLKAKSHSTTTFRRRLRQCENNKRKKKGARAAAIQRNNEKPE